MPVGSRPLSTLMKKSMVVLVSLLLLTPALFGEMPEIMPLEEIEKGMRGYGLTVFEGTEVERFDIEVVGILENIGPSRNIILARVESDATDESGVIAGMSGSPIYIGERLVGALAYSWMFSKAPIAGITPIEEMSPEAGAVSIGVPPLTELSAADLAAAIAQPTEESLRPAFEALLPSRLDSMGGAQQLAVPLSLSHFSSSTIDRFGDVFRSASFLPVPSGSSVGGSATLEDRPLQPGDPLAAVLIQGDFSVAATGTVTSIEGDQVAGFGHPFLHMGPVEFPMARAEIVTVLPSVASSFKLSNTGGVIGALNQDRYSGIYGTLGAEAGMIPMTFSVESGGKSWNFDVETVRHAQLLPLLLAMTTDNVLTTTRQGSGDQTIFLEYEIGVAGREPIRITEGWSGPSARQSIPMYLAVISGFLLSNEFEDVAIESIDVKLSQDESPRLVRVVEASWMEPEDGVINPGDRLQLNVAMRNYRGELRRESMQIEVPESISPGPAYLFVGSGSTITRLDFSLVPPAPDSFEQVVEVLERLRPSTQLTAALYTPADGLIKGGSYLPDLPPSMQAVTAAERAATNSAQVQYHPAREEARSLDQVVVGAHRLDLVVEAD